MSTNYLGSSLIANGASVIPQLVTKTSSYTLTAADEAVIFSGVGLTATLPNAGTVASKGQTYTIINGSASAALTIATTSGQTISTYVSGQFFTLPALTYTQAFIEVVSDGSNWRVVGTNVPNQSSGYVTTKTPGNAAAVGTTGFPADAAHQHATPALPVSSTSVSGIVQLEGTAGAIQPNGISAGAGSTGLAADAGHIHPGTQYAPASATPQTVSSTSATGITGTTITTASGTYYFRAVVQFAGGSAAGAADFSIITTGTVTTPEWVTAFFGTSAGAMTSEKQSATLGPVDSGTLSTGTNVSQATIEGMVTFTTAGSIQLAVAEGTSGDTVIITHCLFMATLV